MRSPILTGRHAFTLIEILLCLAIIAILTALLFGALTPSRLRARQASCTSQMHQWGLAISLYVADYDGMEPTQGEASTHSQLGLPNEGQGLLFCQQYLGISANLYRYFQQESILRCPNDHRKGVGTDEPLCSYGMLFAIPDEHYPHLSNIVAKRGSQYPYLSCDQHNTDIDWDAQPTWALKHILVLRANQQVSSITVPARSKNALAEW